MSIEDGKPHPKAASPTLVTQAAEGVGFTFAIQVCSDRLGILFSGNGNGSDNQLLVWNWKKGTVDMVRTLSSLPFSLSLFLSLSRSLSGLL